MTDTLIAPTPITDLLGDADIRRKSVAELLRRGVVVKLSITLWRPYVRLDAEDLGLPTRAGDGETKKVINLGQKALLTQEWATRMKSASASSRNILYRNSFRTLGANFVPVTAYARWRVENDAARAKFWAAVDDLMDNWDEIGVMLTAIYQIAAEDAYDSLVPAWLNEGGAPERDGWVRGYVERVMALRPTKAQARALYSYEVDLEYLDAPTTMTVGDDAGPGAELLDADLKLATEKRRERLATEFIDDVISQMNGIVYETAVGVLGGLAKKGGITGASSKALKTLSSQAGLLTFTGDPVMTAIVTQVRAIADTPADLRDPVQVGTVMRAIATLARRTLADVGRAPKSDANLDIPTLPTDDDVRQARDLVGVVTPTVAPDLDQRAPRGDDVDGAILFDDDALL